ncbi:nicotinate-nucleotide--dimethylbenzimidazole phosphoribosyltransferase [Nocardia seriolae]|nr:nicotinate-nucleotide--dimethylbenzimidazole phosphoribosyltransferase [Nocardia seriolae]MTJ74212.1 nicotinate-nucleotide--dimethylbenzimidazole phosphoribosyltransferase [Nocardia seriolae]MTJ87130.1 nicotinate-nucleotide--dimethylbenzimidazole phosphoribosyltransferase [Nocardia seriolae]MTK31124.1 nicotinate-nucleotide--dimethylbenzimidazole phosphoribosyltransferase [Nocardia seriolae]MTK40171.1 nicotinate-nucleotide--dimethylbenzimidazole phosphoribosyltransferase [Nocardia seriolae]
MRTLVLGGARSGKSAFAEQLVASEAVRYVATAVVDPADADFAERIAAHRARRPAAWTIVEGDPVAALSDATPVTLVDDLGTWLTARLDARAAWESPRGIVGPDIDALVAAVAGYGERLIIVSPEVGLGVIPATASGRLFRDEIGTLNQRLAEVCDEVFLVVAGQALQVKPDRAIASAAALSDAATSPVAVATSTHSAASAADRVVAQAGSTAAATSVTGEAAGDSGIATGGADAGAELGMTGAMTAAASGAASADVAGGAGVEDSTADAAGAASDASAVAVDGPRLSKPVRISFGPVAGPDAAVRAAAEERQSQLTKPAGALGRLEKLANWVAACQGVCPPKQFERARVVVFAADHGVAQHGVSAYPSEVTAQMVANFLHGGAAVNVLARLADASVRVEDIAVAGETAPEISRHKVRRSSGSIDREDALSEAEVQAALAAGASIADEEIDSGADLLIAGDMGIGNTTPATVLIATITDTEPVIAVGRGTGVDDAGWIRKTAAIRDAMWRARPVVKDPVALLRTASGADFAAMAGFLARAAARRTPVILDGVVVTAAALVADQLAPGARAWWVAGHRSSEPSHTIALQRLDLEPLVDMSMRLGEGSGAVTALPLLRAAVATLAEMATFAEAGVSTADADTESGGA